MKKFRLERIGIILFCGMLIGSCVLTFIKGAKPIAKSIYTSVQKSYKVSGISGVIEGSISGLEAGVNENIYKRTDYINLFGLTSKILDRHYIIDTNPTNSVVKDNNGQLQFICFEVDTSSYVEQIAEVKEVLDEMNTPLLYVQTPLKTIEGYTQMPRGIMDYANTNTDQFVQLLEEKGINLLDLRKNIDAQTMELSELFYTTDHHWKTQTAFWAVGKVVEYLKAQFGMALDPDEFYTDEKQYKNIEYEKSFLGSQGRRVGKYYDGIDDYTLMLPKFETNYTVTIHKTNGSTTSEGTFEEAIVKHNLLKKPEDLFTNRYAAYFGADFPEVEVENHLAPNDMKVLILKDSFGLPFSAFLSTMVKEVRLLDMRYYNQDVKEYIKEYQPDLVLYVYKSINTQK